LEPSLQSWLLTLADTLVDGAYEAADILFYSKFFYFFNKTNIMLCKAIMMQIV